MVTIFTYMIGFSPFRGCRQYKLYVCYLNFSGTLPWQPNLGKSKPKLHKFQFYVKYCNCLRECLIGEFKYTIGIFKRLKGVAMATKFKQKSAKIALISVLCKKSRNSSCEKRIVGFSGSESWSSMLTIRIIKEQRALPWQLNRTKNMPKLHIF